MQNFLGRHRSEAERTGLIHLDGGDGRALPLLVMAQVGQQRLTRRLYLRRQAALAEDANQPRTQRGRAFCAWQQAISAARRNCAF